MSYFSIYGVVEAPGRASTATPSIGMLATALGERFDLVVTSDGTIDACASNLTALTLRGPRTHPMLPFERVRLRIDSQCPNHLMFELNFKMQVVIAIISAVMFGLSASIDSGLIRGFAFGIVSTAALFVLNHLLSRHRAFKWLSSQWANSLAPADNAACSHG